MATLVLTVVGGVIGGPIGAAIGGLVGNAVDHTVFGPPGCCARGLALRPRSRIPASGRRGRGGGGR